MRYINYSIDWITIFYIVIAISMIVVTKMYDFRNGTIILFLTGWIILIGLLVGSIYTPLILKR